MANRMIEKIDDKQAAEELAAFIESRRLAELQRGERLREYLDTRFDATPHIPDERGNLPPCPFCNGRALCRPVRGRAGGLVAWLIDCECGRASADGETKTEAVASWSRRTPPWVATTAALPDPGEVKLWNRKLGGHPVVGFLDAERKRVFRSGGEGSPEWVGEFDAWMDIPTYNKEVWEKK
jgi:hypothetical protein